jgi:hypothetical protein
MLTHATLASRLMRLGCGESAEVLGVTVRRLPPDSKFEPSAGRYRIDGGEVQLLLVALDRLAALAGYRAVSGGVPWREPDDGPAPPPSYHGRN